MKKIIFLCLLFCSTTYADIQYFDEAGNKVTLDYSGKPEKIRIQA